jgi:hypothetical protein
VNGAEFSFAQFLTALLVAVIGSSVVVVGAIWTAHRTFERNRQQERQAWLFAVLAELNLNLREIQQMHQAPSRLFPLERAALDQSIAHLGYLPPQVGLALQEAALFIRRFNATTPLDNGVMDDVVTPLHEAVEAIALYMRGEKFPTVDQLPKDQLRHWGRSRSSIRHVDENQAELAT